MFAPLHLDFADALFDPAHHVPADIAAIHANAATSRFNIYRNNVTVSLLDALAARFPATQQIVGEEFFKSMARVYIHAYPPSSPLMMFYGDTFADFIASFEAASELPYLADLARLEAARTRAYHAEDRQPLDPAGLQAVSAADIGYLHFELHPSVEIISSKHPIATIWAMHEGSMPLGEIADWHSEAVVVARPEFDVVVHPLTPGGAAFLQTLSAGQSLTDAVEAALASDPSFDLATHLAGLFSAGLTVALSIVSPEDIQP